MDSIVVPQSSVSDLVSHLSKSCRIDDGAQCEVVYTAAHSLTHAKALSPTSTLILFTPVLQPFRNAWADQISIDPFEILGRAIEKYNARIRHVPFIPSIGFTDTHAAFTEQADIVVVVIHDAVACVDSASEQVRFARSVAKAVRYPVDPVSTPFSVVCHFGRLDTDARSLVGDFEVLLQSEDFNRSAVHQMADLLFGSPH